MNVSAGAGVPQLWGGIECSIVRLQNVWRNQLVETGHVERFSDLGVIAELGIRTLRYPVLWETVSPGTPDAADFSWHDIRLARLRELNIEVIAGLLHHGSGPRYTNLLDPTFPERLAQHALKVARRYPWLRHFTPVNEPLTTARFSTLYSHWYPHTSNPRDFARALVNQCRAVCLSMRSIRTVIPDAGLVQTEDLGKVFSTPLLEYQARYENERRWLTFDLLLGHVDHHHPWFSRLQDDGIAERELMEFVDEPCPPDIIGVNHYLTSERFLDHRRQEWPAGQRSSGNGRHRYVDLEAVRVQLPAGTIGPEARLREVCDRYDLPVAVTEVHHGCSRDEQLRWLAEVWTAARTLAAEGRPVVAVTAWALFGCFDWNSLLTRGDRSYEPGAFDIRSSEPRLTAIGKMIRTITHGGEPAHAVLDNPGWWRRDMRFYRQPPAVPSSPRRQRRHGRTLITGADGALGQALQRICAHRGLEHVAFARGELDMADPASVRRTLELHRPWAVVDAAGHGYNAAVEPNCAFRFGGDVHNTVAFWAACAARDIPLLAFSTDSVFDGHRPRAFVEDDAQVPSSPQNGSKETTEARLLAAHPQALIARTSALYGPWEGRGTVLDWLRTLASCAPIRLPADMWCSPTYVPDLAHAALDLLVDAETGIWHLVNDGRTTWHGFGMQVAEAAGLERRLVLAQPRSSFASAALASTRGKIMPSLTSALHRFLRDCEADWTRPAVQVAE